MLVLHRQTRSAQPPPFSRGDSEWVCRLQAGQLLAWTKGQLTNSRVFRPTKHDGLEHEMKSLHRHLRSAIFDQGRDSSSENVPIVERLGTEKVE